MRRLLLTCCLLGVLPAAGWAQRYEDLAVQHSRPPVYAEAVALPAGGRNALFVVLRVPNRLLVFTRNRPATPGRAFESEIEWTAEVYRDGQRVAERVWKQTQYAATFEETQRDGVDLEGLLRFDLPPGTYTVRLASPDDRDARERAEALHSVTLASGDAAFVGAAVPVRRVQAGSAHLRVDLVNLGGDLAFGQPARVLVPLYVPDTLRAAPAALHYTLRRVDDPEGAPEEGPVVAAGQAAPSTWFPLATDEEPWTDGGTVRWALTPSGPAPWWLAPIDLQGESLDDGAYVLETTLTVGSQEVTRRNEFHTHWRGMPYSLYDAEVAIRNLRFAEERQTIRALQKGTRADQEAALRAYWAARDPTPGTVFNELMAEYYARVDHAAAAFSTGSRPEPDGLRSDQAAVYIVHGPPGAIDRRFPESGGVEEQWTYPDGRQFVFWAATSLDVFQLRRRSTH